MSGYWLLDWLLLTLSLFNTILLIWLGATVLLNADRRSWGIWLGGGGLLSGGLFFLSHTAILGQDPQTHIGTIEFWWRLGWLPLALLPYAWYIMVLWYAGFWSGLQPENRLRRRHRFWMVPVSLYGCMIVGLALVVNGLPSFWQIVHYDVRTTFQVAGIPALLWFYPPYLFLCMLLALDGLRQPENPERWMGEAARLKARPWLTLATVGLLLVGLLVGLVLLWAMTWVIANPGRPFWGLAVEQVVAWVDALISALITGVTLLVGQAIVLYEIFTGRSLPRQGLLHYWRRAIILDAGYSSLVGLGLALRLESVYGLLASAVLMILFYALLTWRSFIERQRLIAQLRPFVNRQGLYAQLTGADTCETRPGLAGATASFYALCEQILSTRYAWLIPVGPLASLFGPPLAYPADTPLPEIDTVAFVKQFNSPQVLYMPTILSASSEAGWAIPLWGESGLMGLLVLGDKREDSLYTEEEIEVARLVSERLMDGQASAEMARRLMSLQRQRLAESRLQDQDTRRRLHDDILPRLHTSLLALSALCTQTIFQDQAPLKERLEEILEGLGQVHRQTAGLLRAMPVAVAPEVARFGLIPALHQVACEELRPAFDRVDWSAEPQTELLAQQIPFQMAEVFFCAAREAIRNAARHGRGSALQTPLSLSVQVSWQNGLQMDILDNGIGVDPAHLPDGKSSTGQGLALHTTLMAVIGGTLSLYSIPGQRTRVSLNLPRSAW